MVCGMYLYSLAAETGSTRNQEESQGAPCVC